MSDIGDYYDRKARERSKAHAKWLEAIAKHQLDPSPENTQAKSEAYEAMIDAGNTGD